MAASSEYRLVAIEHAANAESTTATPATVTPNCTLRRAALPVTLTIETPVNPGELATSDARTADRLRESGTPPTRP
ncbi:hypothetical protein GCM10010483_60640 [Actinokineospora diospyrosa]